MLEEFRGALTALALVVTVAALAASYNVGFPGQQLLQSLRFHIAVVILILAILLLAGGAWWRGVLFLVVAGASATQGGLIIQRQQQARLQLAAQEPKPLLRLLSFNVLNSNPNGAALADYVLRSGADVVMLMEAWPLASQRHKLEQTYPYRAGCPDWCELIIMAKTPITNVQVASLGPVWSNRLTTAETVIDGTRINLVLAHLVKPYYDDLATDEASRLAAAIKRLKGPLLLAGDFNAAAWSDNIAHLAKWADLAPGPSYPATWPVSLGPLGVPIDNVFTRGPLVLTNVKAAAETIGSNHRGVISEVGLVSGSPL